MSFTASQYEMIFPNRSAAVRMEMSFCSCIMVCVNVRKIPRLPSRNAQSPTEGPAVQDTPEGSLQHPVGLSAQRGSYKTIQINKHEKTREASPSTLTSWVFWSTHNRRTDVLRKGVWRASWDGPYARPRSKYQLTQKHWEVTEHVLWLLQLNWQSVTIRYLEKTLFGNEQPLTNPWVREHTRKYAK